VISFKHWLVYRTGNSLW